MLNRTWLAIIAVTALLATNASAQPKPAADRLHQPAKDRLAMATSSPDDVTGPHGGNLHQLGNLQAEVLIELSGIRLFVCDQDSNPVRLKTARGLAVLQVQGAAKRYRYDLFPEIRQNQSPEALSVPVDLRGIAGQPVEIRFQVVGIPGAERRPVSFKVKTVAPLTEEQRVAAAIRDQKNCPVTGQPLGSMGTPVPVTIGEQTIYVCCAGCARPIEANPGKYLTKQPEIRMVAATEAEAEAIAFQEICPVTEASLGSMGTPLKVTGLERDVFVCCKGCLKRLEKEPEKYLAKLPPLPQAKPQVEKTSQSDARFVATQKVCPVMDEPLDAMGGPYKTVVKGRIVYLCCPGCAHKLHENPTVYISKLSQRGVTPPEAKSDPL